MRRRRREQEAVLERLASLERRLEDLEDTVAAALRSDRLDHLDERIDDLAMVASTQEDLLEVRMHAARLAGEVARSVVELRGDQARLHAALHDHVHARAAAAG